MKNTNKRNKIIAVRSEGESIVLYVDQNKLRDTLEIYIRRDIPEEIVEWFKSL